MLTWKPNWASAAVHRFVDGAGGPGRVVSKMLGSASMVEPDGRKVAFTRAVDAADLADLRGIEVTAHLFQVAVSKAHDARLVVIGDRQFGFAIYANSDDSRLDFRRDYDSLRYDTIEVPTHVAESVWLLMQRMGLAYAAIDFVVTPDGDWVFIGDLNPGGQYGWLESHTGIGLTDALADLLARGMAS